MGLSKEMEYYSIYLGLGEGRTLAKLAEATGRSENYLEKLSSKHKWKARISDDTQLIVEDVKKQYRDREGQQMLAKLTIASRISKLIEDNLDKVPITNTADLKRLLEMRQILEGKPTVITEDVTSISLDSLTDEEVAKLASVFLDSDNKTVN